MWSTVMQATGDMYSKPQTPLARPHDSSSRMAFYIGLAAGFIVFALFAMTAFVISIILAARATPVSSISTVNNETLRGDIIIESTGGCLNVTVASGNKLDLVCTGSDCGDFFPCADCTQDIGTSSQRWANLNVCGKVKMGDNSILNSFVIFSDDVTNFCAGPFACMNMTGSPLYVAGLGFQAGQFNTQSNVVFAGSGAGYTNTGNLVNFIGNGTGYANSGTNVIGMGPLAAAFNEGNFVNAIGTASAEYNTGSDVNAAGANAALHNSGNDVDAIGQNAASLNSGSNVGAFGSSAAYNNSGDHCFFAGQNAGFANSFDDCVGVGRAATCSAAQQAQIGSSGVPLDQVGYGSNTWNSYGGTGTSTFTAGTALIAGSGASVACTGSHVCDSFSGTITLTTGTGIVNSGTVLTITMPITRATRPNCMVQMYLPNAVPALAIPVTPMPFPGSLEVNDQDPLLNSTVYAVTYWCGGI